MPRVPCPIAARGSQKWLQIAVNNPHVLDTAVSACLKLPADETIEWLSPCKNDDMAEYSDEAFLTRMGVTLPLRSLASFWPSRGPRWDGLGKTSNGQLLLVEAKAHLPELVSPPTQARAEESRSLIQSSLDEVRTALGANEQTDWMARFYQYTNRLAFLYLLRKLNNLHAHLVFVGFTHDTDMHVPESADEWKGAMTLLEAYLGLPKYHCLSPFVHHVYIDTRQL